MALKVYSLPNEVPAPKVDYRNYDQEKVMADEKAHSDALKEHYSKQGYTGKMTGQIFRYGVADGYAQYMCFEAPRGSNLKIKFFLIHLPYGDGYHFNYIHALNKGDVQAHFKFEANWAKAAATQNAKDQQA